MQTSYSLLYKVAQNLVSMRNYHFVYNILCGTKKLDIVVSYNENTQL